MKLLIDNLFMEDDKGLCNDQNDYVWVAKDKAADDEKTFSKLLQQTYFGLNLAES